MVNINEYMKELLIRSKGNRTISKYADEALSPSYSYVSRIMNGKLDGIPSEKLVDQIILSADPPFSDSELSDIYDTMKEYRIENINKQREQALKNILSQNKSIEETEDFSDDIENTEYSENELDA